MELRKSPGKKQTNKRADETVKEEPIGVTGGGKVEVKERA